MSGPVKRVAAAVGEGSMATAFMHQYLKEAAEELPVPSAAPLEASRRLDAQARTA